MWSQDSSVQEGAGRRCLPAKQRRCWEVCNAEQESKYYERLIPSVTGNNKELTWTVANHERYTVGIKRLAERLTTPLKRDKDIGWPRQQSADACQQKQTSSSKTNCNLAQSLRTPGEAFADESDANFLLFLHMERKVPGATGIFFASLAATVPVPTAARTSFGVETKSAANVVACANLSNGLIVNSTLFEKPGRLLDSELAHTDFFTCLRSAQVLSSMRLLN
ncbi:hypothetical protein HPB48_022132 [Haemaphysalis longicornis]|uniref:Uncharacterized protein n=1 Tax=Haemaphysalis longicornis TaxID=44386 RepID=A0A9J6GG97_HAELO|nr:hypothetical protein HPB48_022132 [Haemaphysalis longicornis]